MKATIRRWLGAYAPALYGVASEGWHYLRFFAGRPHEPDFLFFRHLPGGTGLFVDAGGNTGISALSFACVNAAYRIHSFEPNLLLRDNLRRAGLILGRRHEFTMCALGEERGETTLFVPVTAAGGRPITAEATLARELLDHQATRRRIGEPFFVVPQSVRVARLDDFILSPDVVKLDLQAWELPALRGAAQTLSRHRPLLLIERNEAIEEVMSYLAGFAYQFFYYDAVADRLVRCEGDWPSPNYFALHPERHASLL